MTIDIKTPESADDFVIELSDDLNETMELPKIKFRLSQRIIFVCEGVRYINSEAIQIWTGWMNSLDERQQIVFEGVPPRIVDYFNMMEGFLPKATTVESFFVPYECEKCGHEELFLAHRGKDYVDSVGGNDAQINLPKILNCSMCKSGMEISVWEEKYLKFLKRKVVPDQT